MAHAPSYQQPDLVDVWDKVSERYRTIDLEAPDHRANMERFLESVGPPAGRSFCEVGSGSGTTSAALARMGAKITLVDISPKSLAFARNHFEGQGLHARYAIQDGLKLGFRDGVFDVVWNGGVIEHFTDDGKVALIREMYRVTRPGGLLLIVVPNAHDWPFRLGKWIAERRGKWIFGYEDDLSEGRFRGLAARAGLPRIELTAHNPIVGWWFLPFGRWTMDWLGLNTREWHARHSRFGHALTLAARKPE
ncbi:MAG TPA: methyltransferase domain-containing protein [Candidatus Limnocylindrales bacterium]|nr:methyltransferase domain-containing protein [Candidatus Limnocylindrales bacterium]